uniref:Phytocyanin domain-containing protein n=1 Tax=Arundo donax TaxID=35708 RepID=A0A0A8XSI6_ARUDO
MPGRRYFICGAPGHCLAGMKMEVAVADRPAPTTPSPPPLLTPPGHAKRRPAPAPMPLTPAPRSWAPAPAPAAAPPSRAGHKKHTKRHCPPKAAPARAPTPTVQSVEAEFPLADFAPMSSAPPPPPMSSAGPVVPRAKWGKVTVVLGALVLLAL